MLFSRDGEEARKIQPGGLVDISREQGPALAGSQPLANRHDMPRLGGALEPKHFVKSSGIFLRFFMDFRGFLRRNFLSALLEAKNSDSFPSPQPH